MAIAGAPNQMWPQGAREQSRAVVRGQHTLLCERLGLRVVGEPPRGIRRSLVDAVLIVAIERDARATGVDESPNIVTATSINDVLRAEHVGVVEIAPWAPDTGDRPGMKHDVHVATCTRHSISVAKVALDRFDTECVEFWIIPASQRTNVIAASDELLDDRPAQKTAAAGDEGFHGVAAARTSRHTTSPTALRQ